MNTQLLQNAVLGEPVSREQAADLLRAFASGEVGPELLAAALTALRIRGESVPVLLGFVDVLREHLIPVNAAGLAAVDLCGTGGDGQGTVNLSTAAAFVVAGAGVPVAKHGNHGVSSPIGSADVLAALGIAPSRDPLSAERALREFGLGFIYAPAHHPLFARIGPVRRQLGFRTAFNLLGPLCNPARVRRQVIGVPSLEALETVAQVLLQLRVERALVVHTPGPYDEVSLTAPALGIKVEDGELEALELAPELFGTHLLPPDVLKGGDAAFNAGRIQAVLEGEASGLAEAICANAACALWIAGAAKDLREGFACAKASLQAGHALAKLQALRGFSQEQAHDLAV
ncbi:MAG: anthranilate phosphoribosyltransferase [Holophaga sp.]|nr:anthranilate phosphoribosyltransferase [Holophaga sp.]